MLEPFCLHLFQVAIRKKREEEDGGKRAKTGNHFSQNDSETFQTLKGSLTRSRTLLSLLSHHILSEI